MRHPEDLFTFDYIECTCLHPSHVIRISRFEDSDDTPVMYIELSFKPASLLQRLKTSIKYLLNLLPDSHQTIELNQTQAARLAVIAHQFKATSIKHQENNK